MNKKNFMGASRKKYIHNGPGTVGKVKFIAEENTTFDGILQGADYGIVRFGCPLIPNSLQTLTPGLGLKFLRDGMDSANLVAMYHVDGQPGEWNFFKYSFNTQFEVTSRELVKKLTRKFA